MAEIKDKVKNIFRGLGIYFIIDIKNICYDFILHYILPQKARFWGALGANSNVRCPVIVANPKNVFIGTCSRIGTHATIYNASGKVQIGDNVEISKGVTIVTGNHAPVVGVPITVSNKARMADEESDIIIESEAWLGINVTLISGAYIGRGAIVGACSLVNKYVPPYAVVAGIPAKIIAVKFSKNQIMEHESILYKPEDRMSENEIEKLFDEHYKEKKYYASKNE